MRDYVLLYVNKTSEENPEFQEILKKFKEFKIKHRIVDLNGKLNLYGNETSLEGLFALDFSETYDISIPVTPLAVAEGRLYSGSREIFENLEYFKQNYPETR